jgi:hypothetical protein
MDKRPAYSVPENTAPEIAAVLLRSAARRTVYVDPQGEAFWLKPEKAQAIHARHGGQLFPPSR